MSSAKRVFLSHTVEDTAFAGRLAGLISAKGVEVVSDVEAGSGNSWPQSLRHNIETVSALILLIPSETARNRNNLWFEAGAARTLGKRVLAVLPPSRRLAEVPNHVADVVILDADQRPLEDIADTLFHSVPDHAETSASAMA